MKNDIVWLILLIIFGISAIMQIFLVGHNLGEKSATECKEGYYEVKLHDSEKDEEVWIKTDRKCKEE